MTASSKDSEFTGKYEQAGLAGRILVDRFFAAAAAVLKPVLTPSARVLEVGCGAGYSTERIARWCNRQHLVASDISDTLLAQARARNPQVQFVQESVYALDHADRSFDSVIMLEVLEHLEEPQRALTELHRVARGHVLLSTPREPLWRLMNLARGKYLRDLGNTPGHIQHWSTRGLKREVGTLFRVEACATPTPWTILLLSPRS